MKKIKLYMLLLLVPLLLMGCVEKGSSSSSTGALDSTGGYTWTQLKAMVNGTNYADSSVDKNNIYLGYLIAEIPTKTTTIAKIKELESYLLSGVFTPINTESSSFDYTASLMKVQSYTQSIIEYLAIYDYDTLGEIKEELGLLIADNMTSTADSSISSATDTTLAKYYTSLESTITKIRTLTSNNVFYSPVYNLYSQYTNMIGTTTAKTYLKNSYGLDIDKIDQTSSVTKAKEILVKEISNLVSNGEAFDNKGNLKSAMENLLSVYTRYLAGSISYSNVEATRTSFRLTDDGLFSSGTISVYSGFIDNIYAQLKAKDTSNSETKTAIKKALIDHIDEYYDRNNEYTLKNYLVINSKSVNIYEEYEYLKSQTEDLSTSLGLNIPW